MESINTSLDIISLIENNPITKLSSTYNNKLLLKIKNNFKEFEQILFITSFYCYLHYNQYNDYIINLDNLWHWLGFNKKEKAKILLEKNFILDIDYKIINDIDIKKNNTHNRKNNRGGHNKETIMLNIKTFKLYCIKADTKKAKELHEYYVKLEEILQDVISEECNELKQQLENKDNKILEIQNKNKDLIKHNELEKQNILLREFGNIGSLIYIMKVKTYTNKSYVIKIGESRIGVLPRFNEHKLNYDEILLLDCFLVNRSKDFESYLHNHEKIKYSKVTNLKNHENEKELFLIGKDLSYTMLLNIIKNNIKNFNDNDVEKLKLECEKLKLLNTVSENNIQSNFIQEIINTNKILLNKIDNLEKSNKEILIKLNSISTKTTTNFNEPLVTLGPRLQKINPENMTIIKIYESVSECLKEDCNIKRPSIQKAVSENIIYMNYRWMYVDRELDPNILYNIKDTKITKIQNIGYIAKLDANKKEILNVYLDRKTACKYNDYKCLASLDEPVKQCKLSNGHYYILYNDCSDLLISEFEKKYGKPILYKNGIGQYDKDNKLINEYICKNQCLKILKMSDKTLEKALINNIMYNNNYYRLLESKLKII